MAMINAVSKLTWRAFERHYSLTTYERLVGNYNKRFPSIQSGQRYCLCGTRRFSFLICADIIALVVTFYLFIMWLFFMRVVSQRLGFNEYLGNAICAFTAMFIALWFLYLHRVRITGICPSVVHSS